MELIADPRLSSIESDKIGLSGMELLHNSSLSDSMLTEANKENMHFSRVRALYLKEPIGFHLTN